MEQLQKMFLACFNRLKSPQQNGYEATHTDALLLVAATDFEVAPMFTLSLRMRRKIRPREGGRRRRSHLAAGDERRCKNY